MKRQILHESIDIFPTHRDNYLLSRWVFGCHHDIWLWFALAIDNAVYLVDLFGTEGWESFLNFKYFQCVDERFECYELKSLE